MLNRRVLGGFIVVAMVLAVGLPAAATNIPNWSAPPTWTPPATSGGGRTALTQGVAVPLIPMTPCRVMDTRTGSGQLGAFGPPTLAAGVTRTISIPLHTVCTGVPTTVYAYSLNVTVTNTGAGTFGYVQVWPTGQPQPTSSTVNFSGAGVTLSNATVVQAGTSGQINVYAGNQSTDVTIDINGYYSYLVSNSQWGSFPIVTTTGSYAIYGEDSKSNAAGVWGEADNGTSSRGVYGTSTQGFGVLGVSSSNVGVKGVSSTSNGVWAQSTSLDGLYALGARYGTYSVGVASTGVMGITEATSGDNHGVFGSDGSGVPYSGPFGLNTGGLFNSRTGGGVYGTSRYIGVGGQLYNGSGAYVAEGLLGTTYGSVPNLIFPFIPLNWTGPWAVFAHGDFGATGAKHFIEPHPTDAAKVIVYSSLEGREVGTYFRGTASIVNHEAVIVIPEDFRTVTAEEGLTIQVTPIGAYSQVYIESQDLNQIVIRGSRDVQFHYMVNGVRRAFKNFEPVQNGLEFMPRTPSDRMPLYLTEEAKARLISNGTYNPDGTVNMSTAERAGFTKVWADREAEAKAAAEKNAAERNAKAGQQQ